MNCNDYESKGKTYNIDPGETITIPFPPIYLMRLKSCDGEFKNFTEGKVGWKWEKCWYRIEGSYDNNNLDPIKKWRTPILIFYKEVFKNNETKQNTTYKDLSFDYSIEVCANKEDSIKLQVWNYTIGTEGDWEDKESKSYRPPCWKKLTWHAVNLTHDNLGEEFKGKYRFVGAYNESSPEYEGHVGPTIEERFYNPKVSYNETMDELSFDYEVKAWVNMVEDNNITLEVKNFSTAKWEPKGSRSYTIPGENQPLRWESVNLSCDNFNGFQGKYKFVGSYNKSEDIFYMGPVIEENFYDLRVTPKEGTNNKTFNYSVTVNANICDKIELQVKNHTTGRWDTKETRDYIRPDTTDKNQTLKWLNISLNSHELNRINDSKFRFMGICSASSSEKELPIWPIRPAFENLSVKPERGLYTYEFNYSVDVKAEKGGEVKLLIFCPDGSQVHESYQEYNKPTEWQPRNWSVQLFENCTNKIGYAKYRFEFWYKGSEIINQTEKGPYIGIADFRNATVEPEIGTGETSLNYSVEVIATETGKVELLTKCPKETKWKRQGPDDYDTPEIWELFKWTKIKLPCDSCGNAEYKFEFTPEFTPGFVDSKNYTGPKMIKEEFGELFVSPDKGTDCTEFNFSVNFSGCIEEDLTLQIWNSSSEKWENVSTRHYIPPGIKPIRFSNITCPENLVPQWSDERVIKWRVNGSISNSSVASIYWDIELKWYNSSFSQEKGWWNDTFNFSVNLSANLNGSVELQIKLLDGLKNNSWNSVGEKKIYHRPNPQILRWENASICSESYEGNTSYRFVFYWRGLPYPPSHTYTGPKLFIPLNIHLENNTVEPEKGVYYNFKDGYFRDTTNPLFNYSIEVTADKPTTLKLVLIDPCGEKHNITEECKYICITPHQSQECSWRMIELPSGQAGKWNYTFLYNDTRYGWKTYDKTFEGPEIIAVFENYTLDPESCPFGDPCNVTVCMKGTEEMNVTLEAFNLWPGHKNWTIIEPLKQYEPPGEECLNWTIDTFKVPFDELRVIWEVI